MTESRFYSPLPIRTGLWFTVVVPLAGAAVLFLVDYYLIPGIFALPTLLMIMLICLAMRLPPRIVALWSIFYLGVILLVTVLPIPNTTDPAFRPYARTAIFLTGSTGAILLSAYRRRLQSGHEALFRIISALPLAVIVSDISGNILLLNEQAKQLLKNHVGPASELSYFTMFLNPDDHGRTIAQYIGYFNPSHVGTVSTRLRTRGEPPLVLHASITTVLVNTHRYAITMVEQVGHLADEHVAAAR